MESIETKKQIHKHIPEGDLSYVERSVSSLGGSKVFASIPVAKYEKWQTAIAEKQAQLSLYESGDIATKEMSDEARAFQIKNVQREIEEYKEYQERNNQQLALTFASLGDQIKKMYDSTLSEDQRNRILSKIHKMFLGSKYVDEFKSHFAGEVTVKHFIQNLEQEVYPPELLYDVAKGWQAEFDVMAEKFQVWAEKIKFSFKQRVAEFVEQGLLPKEALVNLDRVDSVEFSLQDCFPFFVSDPSLGGYHPDKGVSINLRPFLTNNSNEASHNAFHELVHAISGLTTNKVVDEGSDKNRFIDRKSGVSLTTNAKAVTFPRNRWLNEAITEKLTRKLIAQPEDISGDVYRDEQATLEALLNDGLDEDLVLGAYFENITNQTAPEQKASMFAKLVTKINAIKGEYGFTKLDNEDIAKQFTRDLEDSGHFVTQAHLNDIDLKPDTKKFTVRIRVGKNSKGPAYLDMVYLKADETEKTSQEWNNEIATVVKKAIGLEYSRHYSLEVAEFVA